MELLENFEDEVNNTANFVYGNHDWGNIFPPIRKIDGDDKREDELQLYYTPLDLVDLVPGIGLATGTGQIIYWIAKRDKKQSVGSKIMRKTIRNVHSNLVPISSVGLLYVDAKTIYKRKKINSEFN